MSQSNTEAKTLLALQALQNDPKLSVRRAASIYEVKEQRLRRRQNGIQSRRDWIPKSRRLSDLEEQIIVQFILDLDSRGFPPRLRGVEEMANRLLADRDASPVGKRWASNFVRRHPKLKTRFFRKYDYQRAKCEDTAIIRNWFRLVENTIAKYGIQLADIYNFDETGFMMGLIASGMVVTVIQAINAEGWAIQPFIVVAGQYHLASWYQESNLPGDWAIATTQNGWTDNNTGLEWLKHFDRHTKARSTGSYRLLILDGHESHHSTDFEKYCEENNIITLCMPPHSSHLLQPLDVGCFGPLKKAYGREIEQLIRCSITHVSKTEFFPAFYAAHEAAMTKSNIEGGFRGAGLVPLDPENVISKLDVQLRTPTPVEEEVSLPDPWVSKTPKTVLEASSQSEYLKRRVRRHQSSSPASILEALESFSKGTKAIMHQMALLKSENQILRQANETLSKRRRVKKTRLRKGGKMTLDEGRDEIDQKGIDAQIVAESSRSGGQGMWAPPRERRCGTCGKTGHNSRTCQIEVKDETRHRWVCFECVRKKDPKITAHLASATANIETHLGNQHNIYGGKTQPRQGRKRSIGQMLSHKTGETTIADFQFRNSLKKQFDKDVFQRKLVRWIVQTNQSFRVAENETFRNMLDYLNPIISATNAHLSHDAIRRRVIEEYHFFRLHIIKTLHQSPSAIHIAFDGWTSRNRHPLFGIVAFFLDRNFRPQKIVLGLPNLTDRHTGENIAESVQNILETFELRRDKIGYFTLDNASNNDAAMERLAHGFQWACPMARRIRCFGHVVHLVARTMLLGKDDTSSVIEDEIDTEAHDAWLKRGPVGKLHNLMVWINRSNRVTEMLREAQRQDREKCWPGLLDVIVDNNTRWLSQFYMMSRAIKLRPYIEAVISDVRYEVSKPRRKGARQKLLPRCLEDDALLTEEDWQTIGLYQDLLRHFETCVKKLEGDGKQRIRTGGKEAAYGLMQDICPAYEWLMGHLEEAKLYADQTPEPAHFRTNINLAWVKLNKYYSTIDQSPAYYAATVLHPAIRWDFLYRAYRQRPDWIEKSQELISGLWQEYKQFPVQFEREDPDDLRPMKKAKKVEVDSFSSYLDSFKSTGTAQPAPCEDKMDDELDRWLRLADPVEKDCDPFLYWFNKSVIGHTSRGITMILNSPKRRFYRRLILNLDETPIPFEYLDGFTWEMRGAKSVPGKSDRSGWNKRQATLILYIFADGKFRLRPTIIFHGTPTDDGGQNYEKEKHLYSPDVDVEFNKTAYNNEDLFSSWIDEKLLPRQGHLTNLSNRTPSLGVRIECDPR
ncbi:hypothetical protein MRS44_013183 [Fusarium solani]|uniref:uncharacterized protein n=1 Tax=Fusarium solani TaxID=169388 RepID=UPI0032C41266|nr:hypothetical protein MRS44_013183 [Fusarium solani]